MNITIRPGLLNGTVRIPSSKSYAHRLLIAAALCDEHVFVGVDALNNDIIATAQCLAALGAEVKHTPEGYEVGPVAESGKPVVLDCGESGSTLRFMIPVAAALGRAVRFEGHGRLPERPNRLLTEALRAHGVTVSSDLLPMTLSGRLTGGRYEIAGNVSSQYITGLLMALPLCEEDSELVLTTPLESAAYVDITIECLKEFGVEVVRTERGWQVPGGQRYHAGNAVHAEGDWSSAAFWLAANEMGSDITLDGLRADSTQGDRAMIEQLKKLGGTIDVSGTPDLVPALAVAAALHEGTTRITGAARLRIKESDRLATVAELLTRLGVAVEELEDGLVIAGREAFAGGTVRGHNDHRIVMAAAIAATRATGPVTVTDGEAVNKSYPSFYEAFQALGGRIGEV